MNKVFRFCGSQLGMLSMLAVALSACMWSERPAQKYYPENVGDIAYDPRQDDPAFAPCDTSRIGQYYEFGQGLMYQGEKLALVQAFQEILDRAPSKFSGIVTMRFIVNCQGQTGRHRFAFLDNEYRRVTSDPQLQNAIANATRTLNAWGVPGDGSRKFDYYQYLTFKMNNGKLIELLP